MVCRTFAPKMALPLVLALPACAPLTTSDLVHTGANTALGTVPGLSLEQRAGLLATSGLSNAWSQHQLAQESTPQVTIQINGTQPQPITSQNVWNLKLEDVAPSQHQIAFSYNSGTNKHGNNYEIFIMNTDGSGLRKITFTPIDYQDRHPMWSPDKKRLVYQRELNFVLPTDNVADKSTFRSIDIYLPGKTPKSIFVTDLEANATTGYQLPLITENGGLQLTAWNENIVQFFYGMKKYQLDLTTLDVTGGNYKGKATPIPQ